MAWVLARRILVPLRLAVRRVAVARRPLSVVAFGVALASCALAVAFAASAIVENRAVSDAIDALPAGSRNVEVTWAGVGGSPSERLDAVDRRARAALRSAGLAPDARALVYRDAFVDRQVVRIAAADALPRWLVVRQGRLPRPCSPSRCETVVLGNRAAPTLPALPVVGRAELRPGAPLSRLLGSPTGRARTLVADGVAGADRLPLLASAFRSYTWSALLASAHPTAWTLDELELRLTRARTDLQAASFRFDLVAPTGPLDDVALDARVAYRRLLLVGAECAALLLVFALVAAASLRSGALAASRRLRRFGAGRWQTDLLTAGEAAAIVVPAAVVGWIAGALAIVGLAEATDSPVRAVLERTVLSATGVALLAGLAVLAVLILFATMRAEPVLVRGRGLSVVDVVAGAALVAVVVALAAGQTDPETLARDRSTGVTLLLVPGLLLVAAAVLAARLARPALRLAERLAPRTRPSLRLALLGAARNSGTQLVTVGFLVVSVGLAVFAVTYRSTLVEGERDQAAYAVPLDYSVRKAKAAAGRDENEAPVGADYVRWNGVPVIRRSAQARSLNLTSTIDVLGLPPGTIPRLRWRDDFAGEGPRDLADRIAPQRPVRPVGPHLPADGQTLALPVTVRGDPIAITAAVRTERGSYLTLHLGEARRGRAVLRTPLPRAGRNGTLVGLTLEMPPATAFSAAHAAAEGGAPDVFSSGRVELGQPLVGSKRLSVDYRDWVAGASSPTTARTLTIRYLLTQEQPFRLRPRQPTDGIPVDVIACDSLADRVGEGRVVPLTIGSAVVDARVVASASFFPSLSCPFVVADEGELETAVTASAPGAAVPDEAWIAGPPGLSADLERAARGTPVAVASRRALEAELRDDPLARGTVAVLAAGGLVALALAVIAVLLVVSVELRDEPGDLFDLESQGLAPASLRRQVILRLASLAAFGVVCGLVTGAVLTAVISELVAVGAGRSIPVPPLRLHVAWPELVLALLAFAIALGVTLWVATRRAFSGLVPRSEGR
jgi:hypothetical protein